jgi:hypothetical protein
MSRFNGVLVAALLSAAVPFASAVAVMAADDPPPPKSAAPAAPSGKAAGKPMIVHNPDGTFTVQKEPPDGPSKDSKVQNGLVISPQIVVPIFSTAEKKHDATSLH